MSPRRSPRASAWGLKVHDARRGVLTVSAVKAGGPAANAGIQPGDVLLAIDTYPVHAMHQVSERLAAVSSAADIGCAYGTLSLTRPAALTLQVHGVRASVQVAFQRGGTEHRVTMRR